MRKQCDYEAIRGLDQEGKRAIDKAESDQSVGRRQAIILLLRVPEGRHTVAHREAVGKLSILINEPRRGDTGLSRKYNQPNIRSACPICPASVTLLH